MINTSEQHQSAQIYFSINPADFRLASLNLPLEDFP